MAVLLSYLDNYQAVAQTGYAAFDEQLVVDVLPGPNVPDGNVRIPMTFGSAAAGFISTICTGWTDDPVPTLFLDFKQGTSIAGPLDVFCAPNAATMAQFQYVQLSSLTNPYANMYFEPLMGARNYVAIYDWFSVGSFEFVLTPLANRTPFQDNAALEQVRMALKTTTIVIKKSTGSAVTLVWTPGSAQTIVWANGPAQFQTGKSRLLVHLDYEAEDSVFLGRWTAL